MGTIKVLQVIRQGQIGGGESHLLDLVTGFSLSKITPIILAFTSGHMIDNLRSLGFTCYIINTTHPFDISEFKQISELIKEEQIQLIHAHGSRAASNVAPIAKVLKIPLIYTVHGWSFHQDQNLLIKYLRALSEKLICSMSNQVICVSESNRLTGVKTFNLSNAITIENGINLEKFNPNRKFNDIRQEFEFNNDDFIIGFIGRITAQKDPLNFVKSIEITHSKYPKVKGLFIGEGDLKDKAIEYIQEKNLGECIYVTDFRNDVPDLLNAIDVFCLPSLWEGLSIGLLEAMAMAKALVVTPTDGTKEIIINKENGIITSFNDPKDLSNAYCIYYLNPDLKTEYGNNAKKMIEQRFNSQRVSEQVFEIYTSFLKTK